MQELPAGHSAHTPPAGRSAAVAPVRRRALGLSVHLHFSFLAIGEQFSGKTASLSNKRRDAGNLSPPYSPAVLRNSLPSVRSQGLHPAAPAPLPLQERVGCFIGLQTSVPGLASTCRSQFARKPVIDAGSCLHGVCTVCSVCDSAARRVPGTEGPRVQFRVRAHAQAAGSVPGRGA